jgi:hydrogenase maturation factor
LNNLRWANPTEQNINRTFINNDEEFYDYEYYIDNIKFNSLLQVYNYCVSNSKLKRKSKYENFKRTVNTYLDKNINVYSLNLIRKIITLKDEQWVELNNKYELVLFTHISNYGRLGKIKDTIIPRTVTIDKYGYQRIKLKKLKKEVGIHTLVYEHFKGDIPFGYIIDHIDENKSNNHITNLQLLTQSENIKKTCNINTNHKQTVNIEATNLNTNEVLIFTNKEQFYKHYNITYSYYTYHSYKSNDGTIILNDIIHKVNEIKNKTYEIGNKKRSITMYDKDNNMIRVFNSIADVSKYYKENKIAFHSPLFRKVINTDKEYNIPGIAWKSEEIS